MNIEDFIDWIIDVDKFFNYMEVPEEKMVRLVACRLKGGASAWWERLQNRRIREGKQPIRTWFRMKQLLKRDFLPPYHEQLLLQQYQVCHQGVGSICEYPADFMRVADRDDLQDMGSKFGLETEVHPQPYNVCSLQNEEELAKQHEPVQDTLKTESEVIDHLNKEEPALIGESKEEPKEEEHVSLVPSIDVYSLTKFEEVVPKVVLIGSSAITSQ